MDKLEHQSITGWQELSDNLVLCHLAQSSSSEAPLLDLGGVLPPTELPFRKRAQLSKQSRVLYITSSSSSVYLGVVHRRKAPLNFRASTLPIPQCPGANPA